MKTLRNATAAMAMIAESDYPVSVAQIGRRLGLPRSSASRLMASLRDGGLVEQDPKTRRYVAGELAWRLGIRHRPIGYDADLISETLMNISTATGFTSWMAVLSGTNIVLLRHHQGLTPIQFSVRLGQTLPAHATAVGKALLSRLPDRTLRELYGDRLPQVTPQTITSKERLLDELRTVRQCKIAMSKQETFPGVIGVGGAAFGVISNCPIGMSISFPATSGEPARVAALLRDELSRIGRQIGDDFWL
jgi:DNA-binding IclR family transcriptional regulator